MTAPETTARSQAATLVLAATPLGNAGDASVRLRAALAQAEIVAAEDTRRVRTLAQVLDVSLAGRVVSYYDAVEQSRMPALLESLRNGQSVLLVTDAGMPSVSDPGFRLVTACWDEDIPVTCLPGPSAVTTALAVSGLASDRFCFEGFPPRKSSQRREWLQGLFTESRTCVFFESPHRLADTLAQAAEVLGEQRQAAVCRELTKVHEEVRRGSLPELASWASEGVRGEITVVLEGAASSANTVNLTPGLLVAEVERRAAEGLRTKDAVAAVAEEAGLSKRELYEAVVRQRE